MASANPQHDLTNWDLFVLRHTKPLNLGIHFVSLVWFYLAIPVAVVTQNYYWLALFFASGVLGAVGHYVSGDGGVNLRETTSSSAVVLYVPLLFFKLLRGTYASDLKQAREKYRRAISSGCVTVDLR